METGDEHLLPELLVVEEGLLAIGSFALLFMLHTRRWCVIVTEKGRRLGE